MRILFDHQAFALQPYGGVSRYFYELLRNLHEDREFECVVALAHSSNFYMKQAPFLKTNLHAEWMRYTFENPDVLDKIPKGAALVLLPEDDKELYAENYKALEENKRKGISVFVVTMKTPKPQISNIEIIAA